MRELSEYEIAIVAGGATNDQAHACRGDMLGSGGFGMALGAAIGTAVGTPGGPFGMAAGGFLGGMAGAGLGGGAAGSANANCHPSMP